MKQAGKARRLRILGVALFGLVVASLSAGQLPTPARPFPPPPAPDPGLILSYVTIQASGKTPVPRLTARDFHLFEDGDEQKIAYFAVQDQPMSVGIVWGGGTGFDATAPDPEVRECPRAFMKNAVPGSEYFLLSDDVVTTSYTTNIELIPKNFRLSGSSGDSLYIGMDVLKESANPRKILFVVAKPEGGVGGQLNRIYVEQAAIRAAASGTQIHVISFYTDQRDINHEGSIFFAELIDLTGGSYFLGQGTSVNCIDLAKELRVQYLIGHHSTNEAKDGKWRKLSVKLDVPEQPKLKARIRRGYYAEKARQ